MKKTILGILSVLVLLSCGGKQQHSLELNGEEDLAGLRVAVSSGSCYELELSPRTDITLMRYNTDSDILQALVNGRADVAVQDEVMYNVLVQKESGIKIAFKEEKGFPTAFMFRQDEGDLVQAMNEVQRRMIEDGSMKRLKDFWLTDRYAQETKYTHIPDEMSGNPIRVALVSDSSPICFQIEGEWYGIETDLLRELGKAVRRPMDFKRYDLGSALLAVKTGVADVLCGCIFVTPEREENYLFSEPYHYFHPAYFVVDREAKMSDEGLFKRLISSTKKNLITENRWKYIVYGLLETVKISFLAILLGSLLGMVLYGMTRSRRRTFRSLAKAYNGFMAGIPELVLLLIMFYVVFAKSGLASDLVAVVTFALLFASGVSGIYAASLESIPHGQTEAGLALGFTRVQTFFNIVLPQAVRRGLPLYRGQCVSLLKGTSIVGFIAIQDLTRAGELIRSRTFDAFVPLAVVTFLYFVLVWLIGLLLHFASPKKKVL